MSRVTTALLTALVLAVSFGLAGCDTGDEEPADEPAEVITTVEDGDVGEAGVDGAADDFDSATASIDVSGDVEGSISLATLRSADVVDGLFTATIASSDAGEVLEIAAPNETESATTGTGGVALRLEIATEDGDEVRTFQAGEGTCTITMAPADVSVNGTFECAGLTSDTGDLSIDASGSFAVNRS